MRRSDPNTPDVDSKNHPGRDSVAGGLGSVARLPPDLEMLTALVIKIP
jgi:hypothetical protein